MPAIRHRETRLPNPANGNGHTAGVPVDPHPKGHAYECPICHSTYTKQKKMRKHIRAEHTIQLPSGGFQCPFPHCPERFVKKDRQRCHWHFDTHLTIWWDCHETVPHPTDPGRRMECKFRSLHCASVTHHKHQAHVEAEHDAWVPKRTGRAVTKERQIAMGTYKAPKRVSKRSRLRAESEESTASSSQSSSTLLSSVSTSSLSAFTEDIQERVPSAIVDSFQETLAYDDSDRYPSFPSTPNVLLDTPVPFKFGYTHVLDCVDQFDSLNALEDYFAFMQSLTADSPCRIPSSEESIFSQPVPPSFADNPSAYFHAPNILQPFTSFAYPNEVYDSAQSSFSGFRSLGFAMVDAPYGRS
ncbi:unnamed protein product [Somion occarium]|uniref:C2H2-type domain-containing protein n=1 Tax=Somion occarium TaxID=3059160 RepID=A0ABP1D7X6_9APHY